MHLRGAVALVTGAAQGLGKAFSEALLARGASVCISDIQLKKGKEVEVEFQDRYGKEKTFFVQCDVKSEENFTDMFKAAVSKFGHIDLLVNNAGIGNEKHVKDMIGINLFGVIKGSQLAIDHMRRDKGGRGGTIINVASTAGITPVYFTPSYAATKYGVVGFTESWARNPYLGEIGIQFACLCPAFTQTAILDFRDDMGDYSKDAYDIVDKTGINEVSDVVGGFLKLAESSNCNGDIITIIKGQGVQYFKKNGKRNRGKL